MISLISKGKNLKALSLLEVMVVLAIISMTMISAMTVVLRANAVIKSNEIQDTANDILLQAFELFKAPDDVKVLQGGFAELSQYGTSTTYSLGFENSVLRNGYLKKALTADNSCNNSSEFNIKPQGNLDRPYPICLRVAITPIGSVATGATRYNITLTLTYSLTTGDIQETYLLTRYDGFVEIT